MNDAECIDSALDAIIDHLARERGISFRDYRRDVLRNRLAHRMHARGCVDVAAYIRLLREIPNENELLLRSFLISVTAFFRNPEVFESLGANHLPALVASVDRTEPIRVWCVGVATGEEAYSLAATLAEVCSLHDGSFDVLGTDIDRQALDVACGGLYGAESAAAIPQPYLSKYFQSTKLSVAVAEDLRQHVHFTEHDFLGHRLAPKSAVVADFHVVLLRNVLIYVDQRLQRHGIDRIGRILRPGGLLVLGSSESLPEDFVRPGGLFERVDARSDIYRRRRGAT